MGTPSDAAPALTTADRIASGVSSALPTIPSLAPLLTWAKTWTDVEQAMIDIVSPPKP